MSGVDRELALDELHGGGIRLAGLGRPVVVQERIGEVAPKAVVPGSESRRLGEQFGRLAIPAAVVLDDSRIRVACAPRLEGERAGEGGGCLVEVSQIEVGGTKVVER